MVSAHDGVVLDHSAGQVTYRPGHDLVVSYRATVRWADGSVADETLLAATATDGPIDGTIRVEADGLSVGVWRYPYDPVLPGLDAAVRATGVAELLDEDPASLALDVRAYWPTRRAVVQVRRAGGRDRFVKVLPPHRIPPVVERHARLRRAGVPVPEVLHADEVRGLVVLDAAAGTELRSRVTGAGLLATPSALLDVVSAFASVDLPPADRPRPGLVEAAPRHGAVLRIVAPHLAPAVADVLRRVDALDLAGGEAPGAHGDLHDAQIFVDEKGRVSGVLDVDDASPGDPVDDLARLVAHLVALSVAVGSGGERTASASRAARYARQLDRTFGSAVGPRALRGRVAAALVGLATGPFRVQDPTWAQSVDRLVRSASNWARLADRAR